MPVRFPLAAAAALATLLAFGAIPAFAGSLRIEQAYAPPTPPGARTGAAYFTIRNDGPAGDRLVRVASPIAASADVHQTTTDGHVVRMRAVQSLDVPAHGSVTLAPGGYHVMLMGLAHPLSPGNDVPLTLTFEKAGSVTVSAPVERRSVRANATHSH